MPSLSQRERATLEAVCDTFVPPSLGGGPSLHQTVSRVVEHIPDPEALSRLRLLLRALDQPLANLLAGSRAARFAALDHVSRVAVMRNWAESAFQMRRAGFQALKRLVCVTFYGTAGGGRHPVWDESGYPGPLPPPAASHSAQPLPVTRLSGPAMLDADAVVVGSGAGGAVAAAVLAERGLHVVVLEKGRYLRPQDFSHIEMEGLESGYLDGGLLMTRSGSLPILSGSCVGGGTTINWTTCFPLPHEARQEWADASRVDLFTSERFQHALDRVSERISVNTDHSVPGPRDLLFERGLRALRWPVGVIPRNATGCPGILECGFCGYGCRYGAKQSADATWLRDAVARSARIIERCEARSVIRDGNRAAGVRAIAYGDDGLAHEVVVRATLVVAAAGAINTPGLLARSGVRSPHLGRHLYLHPVTAVLGRFNERVEPWTGCQQTRYSDAFAFTNDGYGALMETGAVHFALPASAYGWEGPERHRRDLAQLAHTGLVGILLRDRDAGRVVVGRDGRPRAEYELSRWDAANLRRVMAGAAEVLAAAGAVEVFTLQQPPLRVRPSDAGWRTRFAEGIAGELGRCRMGMISFHQMGTARMSHDRRDGVVNSRGECFELPGLFVADASAFPLSSGVNPMLTIMALAMCAAEDM